jgi:uncharacterized protein with gpF-like domain
MRTFPEVRSFLNARKPGLRAVILLWLKRIAHHFGRVTIDSVESRLGKRRAPEAKNTFEIFSERVLTYLDLQALDLATTITGNLTAAAQGVLQEAFDEGLGEEETAKLLSEVIELEGWELERIARTEGHTAANVGSDTAARATGAEMVKEWGATDDKRTRPTHAAADGQRVEMDERFQVGDAWLEFPGDPNGPAKEVINCRCVVLYHPRVNGEVLD